MSYLLSCIMPFKNEGEEVEKTIKSILATTSNTEIIAINDCSDDGFDYSHIENLSSRIKYILNKRTIGHGNIDLGVINAEANNCILIDAHMRFYSNDWDIMISQELESHPKSILYGNTAIIHKFPDGTYENEDNSKKLVKTIGAKVILDPKSKDLFKHLWSYKTTYEGLDLENAHITPNILGACYAFAKKWYDYIGGTYGLSQYGLSEACLAVKTWLMGGECIRLQKFVVGHIYRKHFPYKIQQYSSILNRLLLTDLFASNDDKEIIINEMQNSISNFKDILKSYDTIKQKTAEYVKHFREKFVMSLKEFDDKINSKFS